MAERTKTMNMYRKKPVVVEARHLSDATLAEIVDWIGYSFVEPSIEGLTIRTLEGNMLARWGDWIIKGVKDEFYPCKPDIFEELYEVAEHITDGSDCWCGRDIIHLP